MSWQSKKPTCSSCVAKGIWLTNTHLVRFIAVILLYSCGIFMIGYFWGKTTVVEGVMYDVEQMCVKDNELFSAYVDKCVPANVPLNDQAVTLSTVSHGDPAEKVQETCGSTDENAVPTGRHRALVAGFPHAHSAKACYDRLQRVGTEVELKKRVSKNSKGHQVVWYQIVTKPFTNRAELDMVVDRIRQQENITGEIPIVSC